jgi:hypothetical protein
MPAGDRTGPEGMGPRSGRGAGFCNGYGQPGYENMDFARGYHRGRMAGRRRFQRWQRGPMHMGWGARGTFAGAYAPPAPMTEEQEQEALKAEESWLQEQLDAVRSRLKKEE